MIAVSGSRGLVGSALLKDLSGVEVLRLARPGGGDGGAVHWDPEGGSFDAARLEGCDGVVHLAGEPIAARRWSAAQKEKIRKSRVEGTRLLVEGLRRLTTKPRALVSASAVGYYGDRSDEVLVETSTPGDDFLAGVAQAWEAEALRAAAEGIRVVVLRFGVVLAREGGALKKMLLPFRMGAGGRLGGGQQWMSWIHIGDLVRIIRLALSDQRLSGPVNAVSPGPARNADFARTLGHVLRRPAVLPAPPFMMRLALGEMADALLLSSQRAVPRVLLGHGFVHRFPHLEGALRDLLA